MTSLFYLSDPIDLVEDARSSNPPQYDSFNFKLPWLAQDNLDSSLACLDPSLLSTERSAELNVDTGIEPTLSDDCEIILTGSLALESGLTGEAQTLNKTLLGEDAVPGDQGRRRHRPLRNSCSSNSLSSIVVDRGKKRRKTRFTTQQRDVLNAWLEQNRQYPYPNATEKSEIAGRTCLSIRQVETWYSNARKRDEMVQDTIGYASQEVQSMYEGPTPLERYLSSDDEEAADPGAIARAVAKSSEGCISSFPDDQLFPDVTPECQSTTELCTLWHQHGISTDTQQLGGQFNSHDANVSRMSFGASEPFVMEDRSLANAWYEGDFQIPTIKSVSSIGSAFSFGSRQGRRKHVYNTPSHGMGLHRPQSEPQITALGPNAAYCCSLCSRVFKSSFDRRRHENSVHSGTDRWVCRLHEIDPTSSLFQESSSLWWRCVKLSEERRTFYRKDKLLQHLRNTHRLDRTTVHELPIAKWSLGRLQTSSSKITQDTISTTTCNNRILPTALRSTESDDSFQGYVLRDTEPPTLGAMSKSSVPKRRTAIFTLGGSSGEDDDSSSEEF